MTLSDEAQQKAGVGLAWLVAAGLFGVGTCIRVMDALSYGWTTYRTSGVVFGLSLTALFVNRGVRALRRRNAAGPT